MAGDSTGDTVTETEVFKIFQNMTYPEDEENVDGAICWLHNKQISAYIEKPDERAEGTLSEIKHFFNDDTLCTVLVPEIDTVKRIVQCQKVKWSDIAACERSKLLDELGNEIERNAKLFGQVELITRGIPMRDTRSQTVPLLAQYFRYYSGFAMLHSVKELKYVPSGVSAAVISNENALSNVGLFLAPALAAGHNAILQVGLKLLPSVVLIAELAEKIGFPQGVIKIIPSEDGELLPYLSNENVQVLALFVDLSNEKYRGINNSNKRILVLSSYKTPVIIFDNADIDSACDSIVEAVWSSKGLLPWAADTVIIQENIFMTVLEKLKHKLSALKVSQGLDKMADIANPGDVSVVTKAAESQGLEIFKTASNLLLFIGGRFQGENNEDINARVPYANVISFRSIDEAVNLANNTKQGLGAMVWSESVGVINEVVNKLTVTNVWINSSGFLTAADVGFSPMKESGVGWFGGKEGFYEYIQLGKGKLSVQKKFGHVTSSDASIAKVITNARKAQTSWSNSLDLKKNKLLQQFGMYVDNNKKELSKGINEQWLEEWIVEIFKLITNQRPHGFVGIHSGYNLSSLRVPRGLLVIEVKALNTVLIKLILAALINGNALILLNDSPAEKFLKELSKTLPHGVLNVLSYSLDNVESVSRHKDINGYFSSRDDNPVFGFLPVQDSKLVSYIDDFLGDKEVTFGKNVWSDVGKSSSCKISGY